MILNCWIKTTSEYTLNNDPEERVSMLVCVKFVDFKSPIPTRC